MRTNIHIHERTNIQDIFDKKDFESFLLSEADAKNIEISYIEAKSSDSIYIEFSTNTKDFKIRIADHTKKSIHTNNVEFYTIEKFKDEFDGLLMLLDDLELFESLELAKEIISLIEEDNKLNCIVQEILEQKIDDKYLITDEEKNKSYTFQEDLKKFENFEIFLEEREEFLLHDKYLILFDFERYLSEESSLDEWCGFEYVQFLLEKYDINHIYTFDTELSETIDFIYEVFSENDICKSDVEDCLDYFYCEYTHMFITNKMTSYCAIEKKDIDYSDNDVLTEITKINDSHLNKFVQTYQQLLESTPTKEETEEALNEFLKAKNPNQRLR
jgi:hypothetical protein